MIIIIRVVKIVECLIRYNWYRNKINLKIRSWIHYKRKHSKDCFWDYNSGSIRLLKHCINMNSSSNWERIVYLMMKNMGNSNYIMYN